jgi:mono/diheme cytochrome c family protein
MKTWMKRTGIGVGSLVLAVVLGVGVVYAASEVRFRHAYDDVAVLPFRAAAPSPDVLARGRHLATAIGKCTECHGDDLGGKVFMDAGPLGVVVATNLTAGRGGVAPRYTDGQLERAIRHGIGADGRALAMMPSEAFTAMSDADLQALIAYLRTIPPVDRTVPATRVRALGRALYLAGKLDLFPAELMDHRAARPAPVPQGVTVEYGQYLATIGGCRSCHGPELAGSAEAMGPPGTPPPANLTAAGELGKWSKDDFVRALRTGRRPNGTAISAVMPWALAGQMTDDEMSAVWMYLKSVPAKPTPQA